MVKKAKDSERKAEDAKEPEVPKADVIQEYAVGAWAGKPHYTCMLCLYDTLDESMMLRHIQAVHHPLPAPKRGNDVTHQAANEDDGDLNGMFEVELVEVESTTDEQGNEHKIYTIKE